MFSLSDILPIYKVWKFSVEKYSSYRSTKKVWTDGRTDDVITIGHPHFSMRGPNYEISIHGGWTVDKLMLLSFSFAPKEIYNKKVAKTYGRSIGDTWRRISDKANCPLQRMTWITVLTRFEFTGRKLDIKKNKIHLNLNIFFCFSFLKIYSNTDLVFEYSVDRTNIRIFVDIPTINLLLLGNPKRGT